MSCMASESWATSSATARSMRSNRGRDTKPEMELRRLLHACGYRYRVDYSPIPGIRNRGDIVFSRVKVAVFVDGCFWHGYPLHGTQPKAHSAYWAPKLARNKERDAEFNTALEAEGWTVLRFWEHQESTSVAQVIIAALNSTGVYGSASSPTPEART